MARKAKVAEAVVAAPVVDVVSEQELRSISEDRKALKDLEASVRATKKRLEIQEQAVIGRLRKGAKVQGSLVAIVEMVKGRVCVSWKDVAAKLAVKAGLQFAQVEVEERDAKEKNLESEPRLVITGEAVEQYKAE